ncbi:MAG: hypothetical protein MJE12_02060 [Alphaproteobacteria bacterium]|nr:hypothetical protein [Alphaproteobacteria bacterium]
MKSEALGAAGRRVKCSKCAHQWHAMPESAEAPEPAPAPPPPVESEAPPAAPEEAVAADISVPEFATEDEPSAPAPEPPQEAPAEVPLETAPDLSAAESDAGAESAGDPSLDDIFGAEEPQDREPGTTDPFAALDTSQGQAADLGDQPISEGAAAEAPADVDGEPDFPPPPTIPAMDVPDDEPPPAQRRAGFTRAVSLAALILLIAGIGVGLFFMQSKIVMWFPASSKLYAMVGLKPNILGQGLQIIEPTPKKQIDGDDEILVVEGQISNTTSQPLAIPLMRGALLDKFGKELHVWTFNAAKQEVSPGGSAGYST